MKSQHLSNAVMKQLAFQSDVARTEEERAKTTGSFQGRDLFDRVLPLDQIQDSPVDFCLQSWMNNKEHKIVVPDTGKHFEDKTPNSDLSHASLLENEKLMSLTSLEDSSDDDIDDEMFYDDHLEAYFEQLAIPGMIYEDLGGQEPPEKDFKLPTSDSSQANENSLNRRFQSENNSSLISHGSHSSGNSEMTHGESEEDHIICPPGTRNSIGAGNSRRHVDCVLPFSSSTCRIEKGRAESLKAIVPDHSRANENSLNRRFQSENNSSLISHGSHSSGNSEMTHGESEEDHIICPPGTRNSIGAGNSRRHVDCVLPFSSSTCRIEKGRAESLKAIVPDHSRESAREDVLVKTVRVTNVKLNPVYFHDTNADKGGFLLTDSIKQGPESSHQNKHSAPGSETVLHVDGCLGTETSTVHVQKNVDIASLKPVSDNVINSTATLSSPTCEGQTCEYYESIEKSKDHMDLPQSVVYQNEEGSWVTDLAYYTFLNNEQDLNMSLNDEMNEYFRSGSEALDLIAQDEEEFNKEHQFIQVCNYLL
ncbi:PREDICTED: uncharacterized protein LOC103581206 [Galeopterus variegatus]|uniref:Uncharacterized protein LOC103581206 n=1 Tax=Galeopterus variegatus TaxID=482537 RepID=A0ABM0PYX5_GALVR|nr:PREDICTED: uncharacterized protein LOC103581206 [Galeopterus variegatus]